MVIVLVDRLSEPTLSPVAAVSLARMLALFTHLTQHILLRGWAPAHPWGSHLPV